MFRPMHVTGLILAAPIALAVQQVSSTSHPAGELSPTPTSYRPFQAGPRPPRPVEDLRPEVGLTRDGFEAPAIADPNAPIPPVIEAELDDSVPLPLPPVYAETDQGDVLIQPAAGDPYFLGFAAGNHYPPAEERIDPELLAQVRAHYADGRPTAETYAFAMFQRRITPERVAELEALGARVLQFHPHYALKLALPAASIDAVASNPAVRWLGLAQPWQKVHPLLAEHVATIEPGKTAEVYIDVFESDLGPASKQLTGSGAAVVNPDGTLQENEPTELRGVWRTNGWMERALESAGVEVLSYSESTQAFRARIAPAALELLVGLDFVQFVEWNPPAHTLHDESMPMVNADDVRSFFTGGTNSRAVTGIVDSGVENAHSGLDHIFGIGWNQSGAAGGDAAAWDDVCGHGSHVAGTMIGDATDNTLDGVAPGAAWGTTGRLFNVRVFNTCAGQPVDVPNILSRTSNSFTDGSGNTTPRPHVINNSWGTAGTGSAATAYTGTEASARAYDDNAYSGAQLNVFASGNEGPTTYTIGLQASAKNVLTVGNVIDYRSSSTVLPGDLWNGGGGSSVGPTGDNRWKPNVVAPGRWIRSADALNLPNGYTNKFGTSMAAPHVTGAIVGLIDSSSAYTYLPERISAHLMATAFRDGNTNISSPSAAHLDTYGAGRIDGTRAVWSTTQETWANWSFSLTSSQSTFREFTVPTGATRLVVVTHYIEASASSGASSALVNNWNTYIDEPPLDTANNNTGEWVAQQSNVDNTEIRVLSNPTAGTWRVKFWPQSTTGTAYFGASVFIQTSNALPAVNLALSANNQYVAPNQNVVITASASTPGVSADAVFLDSTSSGDSLQASTTTLRGGAVTNLLANQHSGRDLMLGNLSPFFGRTAQWTTRWATEGIKTFQVAASGDNFATVNQSVTVYVDATAPALPTGLSSTSHTVGAWSNDNTIDFTWTASTDAVSGVDGYGLATSTATPVSVPNVKAIEETQTSFTSAALASSSTWYFALKAVDNAGNWTSSTTQVGPYRIDTVAPTQPGVITSSSHTVNVQSCNTTVTVNWSASTDSLAGLAGYVGVWDSAPLTNPTGANNIAAGATSFVQNIGSSGTGRYFHLRARDNAGNLSTTRHFGPVFATTSLVSTYCTGKTNSLGCVPTIGSVNLPSKSAGNFTVFCTQAISQKFGLLFFGNGQQAVPFQGGTLCVTSPTFRTPSQNSGGSASGMDCSGSYAYVFSTAEMNLFGINPGHTRYAQWWMRDPASPSTTGLSNAIRFTVCQ